MPNQALLFHCFSAASPEFDGTFFTPLFQGTMGLQMSNISLLKNSAKALTRSRLGYALFSGAKSLATTVARTFYSLWLEFVGVLAAFFTLRAGSEMIKVYHNNG